MYIPGPWLILSFLALLVSAEKYGTTKDLKDFKSNCRDKVTLQRCRCGEIKLTFKSNVGRNLKDFIHESLPQSDYRTVRALQSTPTKLAPFIGLIS